MPVSKDFLPLIGSSGNQGSTYEIDQSIRFNDDDSPSLDKTYSGTGSRTTFTFSCWFKLGGYFSGTGAFPFFNGGTGASDTGWTGVGIRYGGSGADVAFQGYNTNWRVTTRKFRDHSAWYHLVAVWDTTNIASERVRIYINGVRETDFSTSNDPSASAQAGIGQAAKHSIGYQSRSVGYNYADVYLAEMYFLDGYAYGPSYFGEFNSSNIWIPKEYTGSYGSNGFHIDGRDSSDLGDDESGNGNDFTASGLATHDQIIDTPTNNFCHINPVYADDAPAGNAGTLSNGNLQYVGGGSTFSVRGFNYNLPKSGKWYFEYLIGGNQDGFGFVIEGEQGSINASNGPGNVSAAQGGGIQYRGWRNGGNYTVTFSTYASSSFSAGDLHQVAIDVDNGKWYYGIANSYYANDGGTDGDPSGGTNHLTTFDFAGNDVVLLAGNYSGTQHWNFGQNGTFNGQKTAGGNSDANGIGNFFYAVPTGYLALCSSNLGAA